MPVVRRAVVVPTMPPVPGMHGGPLTWNVHTGGAMGRPHDASRSPDHETVSISPGTNGAPGSITTVRPPSVSAMLSGSVARSNERLVPRLPVTVMTPVVGLAG